MVRPRRAGLRGHHDHAVPRKTDPPRERVRLGGGAHRVMREIGGGIGISSDQLQARHAIAEDDDLPAGRNKGHGRMRPEAAFARNRHLGVGVERKGRLDLPAGGVER